MAATDSKYYAPTGGVLLGQLIEREVIDRERRKQQAIENQFRQQQIAMQQAQIEHQRLRDTAADRRQEIQDIQYQFQNAPRGGAGIDPQREARIRELGQGAFLTKTQPTQGPQVGYAEELGPDVPLYDVSPGIVDFGPTPAMQTEERKLTETRRQTNQEREAVRGILENYPEVAQNPAVAVALELAAQSGNYSGAQAAIAKAMEGQKPKSFVRFNKEKRNPEIYDVAIGDFRALKPGEQIPEDVTVLQEAQPPPPWIGFVGPEAMSVSRQGGQAGTAQPVQAPGGGTLGGLSPKVAPQWQNVIDHVWGPNTSVPEAQRRMQGFNRAIESGNTKELASQVKQAALEGEFAETQKEIRGRETLLAQTRAMRSELQKLQAAGVPTNVLAGGMESVARWLGTSTNPTYVKMETQFSDAMRRYRQLTTGLAFGEKEAAEYRGITPNISNTAEVNMALLEGLENAASVHDRTYWESKLTPEGMRLVFGAMSGGGGGAGATPVGGGGGPRARKYNPATGRVE